MVVERIDVEPLEQYVIVALKAPVAGTQSECKEVGLVHDNLVVVSSSFSCNSHITEFNVVVK